MNTSSMGSPKARASFSASTVEGAKTPRRKKKPAKRPDGTAVLIETFRAAGIPLIEAVADDLRSVARRTGVPLA